MQHPTAQPTADLAATGPFLHAREHRIDLRFDSAGDVPRSFTVVIAQGTLEHSAPISGNGVAIIDNDSGRVVCDGIQASELRGAAPSPSQLMAFALLPEMDWTAFAGFCRSHDSYRGGFEDIDAGLALPNGGSRARQVELGLLDPDFEDIRPVMLREINAISGMPYRFPISSRKAMINDILGHMTYRAQDGSRALAWDIRMNFKWNDSGRVRDGEAVCRSMDRRWAKMLQEDDDVFKRACDQALQPYVTAPFVALDMDESRAVELDVKGDNGGFLVLSSFAGQSMVHDSPRDLEAKLAQMSNDDLSILWATDRILTVDLSRAVRAAEMADAMNEVRASLEADWLREVEDEVTFEY